LENSTNGAGIAGASTLAWSHTVGASATYLIVAVADIDTTHPTSVSFGAASMTYIDGHTNSTNGGIWFYGLASPTPGAATVTVTFAGANYGSASAFSFNNAHTLSAVASADDNSTSPALTVPLSTGYVSVGVVTNTGAHTTTTSGTELFNIFDVYGVSPVFCDLTSGTSYAWTLEGARSWVTAGISIGP
jgi:hypothetical protein